MPDPGQCKESCIGHVDERSALIKLFSYVARDLPIEEDRTLVHPLVEEMSSVIRRHRIPCAGIDNADTGPRRGHWTRGRKRGVKRENANDRANELNLNLLMREDKTAG